MSLLPGLNIFIVSQGGNDKPPERKSRENLKDVLKRREAPESIKPELTEIITQLRQLPKIAPHGGGA